jgi:hypothetical protein
LPLLHRSFERRQPLAQGERLAQPQQLFERALRGAESDALVACA